MKANRFFQFLSILLLPTLIMTACAAPAATPAPAQTEAPAAITEAPAQTEAPAATEPPAQTEAPAAVTEAPVMACLRVAGVENCGEKLNLDPVNQPCTENSIMVQQVYNRLLDLDENLNPKPELAESWESNADGTEWTFHLRKGVKFHDGKECRLYV